jgi:hypothetical protein
MKNKLSARDICALLMGLSGLIIFILLWRGNRVLVSNITKEDAMIENLSALFWIEASVICFYRIANSNLGNKFLLYFWGIFSFVCCGEELSWGQRIFGYSISFVQGHNVQKEVNVHNLVPALNLLDAIKNRGIINWWGFLNAQCFFYLGFFAYFFVMPLVMRTNKYLLLKQKIYYDPPSFTFIISVWPVIIFSFLLSFTVYNHYAIIEAREMFMAFVVLFYVIFYLPEATEIKT